MPNICNGKDYQKAPCESTFDPFAYYRRKLRNLDMKGELLKGLEIFIIICEIISLENYFLIQFLSSKLILPWSYENIYFPDDEQGLTYLILRLKLTQNQPPGCIANQ